MSVEGCFAFVLAAMVALIVQGQTIILVISQSIAHGRISAIPLVTSVTPGDFTAMKISLLGLGGILASSATLFLFNHCGGSALIGVGIITATMRGSS